MRRGRRRLPSVRVATVVAAALLVGCGHRADLPHESGGGIIPATNTYVVKQIWEGFEGASDIVLTSGSQVFVTFPDRGRVVGYFSTGSTPRENGKVFTGRRPAVIAEGLSRTLVVGDVDDEDRWVVRIFDQATEEEIAALRDTSWAQIGGVASDDEGNIYVSDRQSNRVRKYDAEGNFIVELADEGSGTGFVIAPDGLDWQPDHILVVDSGKQWVQGLHPDEPHRALFFLNGDESPFGSFAGLADVGGDEEGNLYIVDALNATVLKYDADGAFDQQVEQNAPEGTSGYLLEPIAVSANKRLAYVLDRGDGKIVTFELDR